MKMLNGIEMGFCPLLTESLVTAQGLPREQIRKTKQQRGLVVLGSEHSNFSDLKELKMLFYGLFIQSPPCRNHSLSQRLDPRQTCPSQPCAARGPTNGHVSAPGCPPAPPAPLILTLGATL